jgi:hypothetical protein
MSTPSGGTEKVSTHDASSLSAKVAQAMQWAHLLKRHAIERRQTKVSPKNEDVDTDTTPQKAVVNIAATQRTQPRQGGKNLQRLLRGILITEIVITVVAIVVNRWFVERSHFVGITGSDCKRDERSCKALCEASLALVCFLIATAGINIYTQRYWLLTTIVHAGLLVSAGYIILFVADDLGIVTNNEVYLVELTSESLSVSFQLLVAASCLYIVATLLFISMRARSA